ncbi:MAG: hypothetical protein KGY54_03530 [Oleiphilaceae bacterium]|nr:hypothetical protein [Oleiphilaceae bacterium]
MRKFFTSICWPILAWFERGETPTGYRASHRKILLAVAFLFMVLLGVASYFGLLAGSLGALIPVVVFFGISLVCTIVGLLGSDRAVAKIWGIK